MIWLSDLGTMKKHLAYYFSVPVLIWGMILGISPVWAERVNVAVAANFTATAKELAQDFRESTGHEAVLSFGSTGKLYAQILHGAPFEVFLAADRARPRRLEEEGLGVSSSRFTYAYGQIALWSRHNELFNSKKLSNEDVAKLVTGDKITRLAVANPKTAPYGLAAEQYLKKLGVYDQIQGKTVYGENIAQTYQFAYTGNAELAVVAYAQVLGSASGQHWLVPSEDYEPLGQDAVLLKRGQRNEAALAFMDYLKSRDAAVIITKFGYTLEPK
ncbi:molybdate ABC transporter substrate-binding protein [uncultured Kiloniella sp.]|uniref:molybdate ABC transporter substrate-binding protein n=1 Tax=uncultured Kiloniella sp. TaxID=1133091 RepID=UPI00262D777C|nr:molybdate ABC transporter substrate-binding protein [uncultured Kiloniella sp.]